jgi:hypothetical protein
MIIYNVTINVEDDIHDKWLSWMKKEHLPQVMATQMFLEYKILRLLSRQEDETGKTYAIQYHCESIEKYDYYQQHFAPALQAETKKLFDGKFVAFRTILEVVD